MVSLQKIIVLCLLLLVANSISGVGLSPIKPMQMNKGQLTKYLFLINPEQEILTKAKIKITFPAEYDATSIASNLTCMASSASYSWISVPCIFYIDSVIVTLGAIKNQQTQVLVSQPRNPSIFAMSSFFSVCLMYDSTTTDCNKNFGKVVFPSSAISTSSSPTNPLVQSLTTNTVGQSSTYQIQFSVSQNYTTFNTIRITFPIGFKTSSNPICQMNGTYNQVIATFVWPDQRSVECQSINKTIFTGQSLKIIGVFNPNYAGNFGNTADGFKIEILQQTTTIILEQIMVQTVIPIQPGVLTGQITQENNFILANAQYTFYLSLLNPLSVENFIQLSFPNSWILYSDQCSIISGISLAPGNKLVCKNSTVGSLTYLKIYNFASASVSTQLVFAIQVRTPNITGTYSVGINTNNAKGVVDSMGTSVSLNGTYGDFSMLSINAITANTKVPVGQTGPLELTFFLNYPLPQTNVLTIGKFVLKIFPQIALPNSLTNGVLKCYFFKTIQASTCTWDTSTSASYTLVTINTPLTSSFQYSQIPITITTEGAVNSSMIGITIANVVTRYRFELQAYTQANSTTPTEVYFSEYIADPIIFPLTTYALTKEVNEYTHLRFQFVNPYTFGAGYAATIRLKIQFLAGGGWATNLGFAPDQIYKRFPCVWSDDKTQTNPPIYNTDVKCDLYTYQAGPHASLTNTTFRGPYILVYGFTNQLNFNTSYRLELGKLLIGSSTNLATYLRFSIIQETPTMLTKYIELYYNEYVVFTTASQSVTSPSTGIVTNSLSNAYINTVATHTNSFSAGSNFFSVIYKYDMASTQSFANAFFKCTIINSTTTNWCTSLGYPVNWIIQYTYLASFATSVSSKISLNNGIYSGAFTVTAQTFLSTSLTLMKSTFTVTYSPKLMSSYYFWKDPALTVYKGVETYFYVYFYPVTTIPDNGFFRLTFASGVQLGQFAFCSSSSFGYVVPEVGLQCVRQTSQILKVYNIKSLIAGQYYQIRVRLASLTTTGTTVRPTVTVQTYYNVNVDPSIVDTISAPFNLNQTQSNAQIITNTFTIQNSRITLETPRVNYVGKFQISITPSSDTLAASQIRLILNNHAWNGGIWTTPNNLASDPLVCLINYIRVGCTYTLSPLNVLMNVAPAGLSAGNNIITLDTEYLIPNNGIKHPTQGGQYNTYLYFLTNTSTTIQQLSFYHKIHPSPLRNFYVYSACNDVGVQNMFSFDIQVDTAAMTVNANNHATLYSRIYIQFPTVDANGNNLFSTNLGGYANTGDLVGCFFNTYTAYYVTTATNRQMCRLIMPDVLGDPVRVEIINHGSFSGSTSSMQVWMARIYNPTIAVTSVPISIRIDHVDVATNNVFRLFYDTFDLFLNSQTPATVADVYVNSDNNYWQVMSGNVGNAGWVRLYPPTSGPYTMNAATGWYYVLDMTNDFYVKSRETTAPNYCPNFWHYNCMAFTDINYIVIWSYVNQGQVVMYVNYPGAIKQTTTSLVAKIWMNQRYAGRQILQLSASVMTQIRGALSVNNINTIAGNYDNNMNRRRLDFVVDFYTANYLPAGGTVQIYFAANVPQVYPHCRSMTNLGSLLFADGSGSYNGEIGCLVQATRTWVITGFQALNAGSRIIIHGQIDSSASGGWMGAGQIITYNNTDSTNIRTNGFIIDYYYHGNFGYPWYYVNGYNSWNVDSEITMEETLPLRINYRGPLRFKFRPNAAFTGSANAGVITVRVPSVSTMSQAGGFTYVSSRKHVCQIYQITTNQETGCIITSITADSSATFPNFIFTIISSSSLLSTVDYRLTITTATGIQPEGLTFPSVAGTYKVDINIDSTGLTNFAQHNQLYLEVYGTKWNLITVTAFNTIPSHPNLIWFQITPGTTILQTQQIIVEIPTKGSNGLLLFANDLGYGLPDGSNIPFDILGGDFVAQALTFMTCRLFYGNQAYSKPAKIICGNFLSSITSTQTLFFAIKIINPSSSQTSVSIPFFLYSVEQGTTYKSNFDVIENAVQLRTDVYSKSDVGWTYSQNQQLQTSGMFIDMITRNVWATGVGEYYVLLFKFPLRNNGIISNGCTYPGSSIYGDAYYHQNLWFIVCTCTSNGIGVPGSGYTTRNLRISGFYTPFYYLSGSQTPVTTYTYHYNSRITTVGYITDGYPNQGPKTTSTATFTMTPIHQTASQYTGSRDDYTFSFKYSTTASVDLSFTQLIAIVLPVSIDYTLVGQDCVEAASSQVEVQECWIDTNSNVIWVRPVVKNSYTSNLLIAVTTRDLAIANPNSNINTNYNQFQVFFYSWQNITQPGLSPNSNTNYCFLIINNLASSGFGYSYNPASYSVAPFSYVRYPHQKYYQDTPFSSLIHRAPFEMEFLPTVTFPTLSGGNYHQIKITYYSNFGDYAMFKIRDLQVFRPLCYLNNQRIRQCAIDTVNRNMIMSFQFSLTANSRYYLKFSIIDPRNADTNGFLASNAVSSLILSYQLSGSATWYYTETDQFPSLFSLPTGTSVGPFRGITAGTATYGHCLPSQLNSLNLLLTFNRTDITGLVFEFPTVDSAGNALFSSAGTYATGFFSQDNGGSYPCGNNGYSAGGNVKCIILNGDHTKAGTHTRIIMTDFTYLNQMNCRFVFNNPDVIYSYVSVTVRAFGGPKTASNLYGNQYMGIWEFKDIFQIYAGTTVYADTIASTSIRLPSLSPWRNQTTHYVFSRGWTFPTQRTSVATMLVYDSSSALADKQFCTATLGSNNFYDDLLQYTITASGVIKKYVFFIRTWQSSQSLWTTPGWDLSYLKCKFYAYSITAYFFYDDTYINVVTETYTVSDTQSLSNAVSAPIGKSFMQNYHFNDGTDTTFVFEVDITPTLNSLTNFAFRPGDQMVLEISFSDVYWTSMLSCNLLGGVISTSPTLTSACISSSSQSLYITNVGGFITDSILSTSKNYRIKVSFLGSALSGSISYFVQTFNVALYASLNSYTLAYQPIFSIGNTLPKSCYYAHPNGCYYCHSNGIGVFNLHAITDTFMRVSFKTGTNLDFSTNTLYDQYFEITYNGFDYGSSCTVTNLIMEISTSTTPGTGVNTTVAPDTLVCSLNRIRWYYTTNRQWSDMWGGLGLSANGLWSNTFYIIVYLTVAPDPAKDLPSLHHEYQYVTGSYAYTYNGGGYNPTVRGISALTSQSLGTSATLSTISNNKAGVTELMFEIRGLAANIGSTSESYLLLAEFYSTTSGWTTTNDPFATYINTANNNQLLSCMCLSGLGPLSISTTSPFLPATCKRRIPTGAFTNYAILVDVVASKGTDVRCYFPEFMIASGMTFTAQFKLVYGDSSPPELTTVTTKYSSIYRITSNSLSFPSGNPSMTLTGFSSGPTETPNFYAAATTVGSIYSGSYTLTGSWSSGLSTPYIYINFLSAGPIPVFSFCSDPNTFLQCRVYTGLVNVVVAQLKSTSATSFSINNGAFSLSYPSSQFSSSTNYGANIYIGTGSWQYSTTISRTKANLAPISSNAFSVFTDKYGSGRTGFQTNILFSINALSQTLYNNVNTGSQLTLTWVTALTYKSNCQAWVQNQPAITLSCAVTTNQITVTSPYYDIALSSNNVFVSLGLLNPTTASVTFTMSLYSSYSSASRFSLTIQTTAVYTTDTTWSSNTQVAKSTVFMYPFYSRFSSVANAPLRVRFVLSSSSISYSGPGSFVISFSQITYSSAHLCYFVAYNSYTSMAQQTQRSFYLSPSCTSSGTTLTVIPPKTLTINSGSYYELIIMPIGINAAGCTALGCATQTGYQQVNFDLVNLIAYSNYNAPSIVNQQVNRMYNYEGSSYIGLQQIYLLSARPAITSIYIGFSLSFNSSFNYPTHYIEITLFDLQAAAFAPYVLRNIIPCQLSNTFLNISGRQPAQCRIASADTFNSNFIKVRIQNIGFLTVGNYWVTFDDILLPTPSGSDRTNKFDVSIAYYNAGSNIKYSNFFPEIFIIDNTNTTSVVSNSAFTFTNPSITLFGAPIVGQVSFTWPFDSTNSSYESKVSLNFNGGYSAVWNNVNTVTLVDSTGTYQLLWINYALNKMVFLLPNKANGAATVLNITSLSNPYPFQRQLYNVNNNIVINFYNNFFLQTTQTFSMPSFTIYTMNPSLVYINQNLPSNTFDYYPTANSFSSGSMNVLLLSVAFDQLPANIIARNLGIIDIKFTSGLTYLDQCRYLRNSSTYVNTLTTCQTSYDGTYWHVMLYDVVSSQLNVGWWIQIFGTYTAATLTYTSYVKASSNSVVQYQSTYSFTMAGYNASRSIPTTLSWLNNRYVPGFYQNQWRYLNSVAGQTTPYFRFRFTCPVSFDGSGDNFRVYFPTQTGGQAFTPKISGSNMVCQFLPAMSADRDFSIGRMARCYLTGTGGQYIIHGDFFYGGLTAGADYLLQVSEVNTATSTFYAPTVPSKQFIQTYFYRDEDGGTYWNAFYLRSYSFFRAVTFLHTTTTVSDYDTMTINYTPYGSLSAGSGSQQVVMRLSVETRYHAFDGGITSIYTADSRSMISGKQFSGVVGNPNNNEMYNLQHGSYSSSYAPLRYVLAKQNAYTDNVQYTWIVPLILNPTSAYITIRFNLSLVYSPSGSQQITFNHYQSLNQYYTVADTSSIFTTSLTNGLRNVQSVSNVDLSVNIGTTSLPQWNCAIFKINNALPGLLPSIATPNDTSNYNYYYFKYLNMIMAQKKTTNTITSIGIGSSSSVINYQSTFGLSWVRVFSTSNVALITNPYTLLYSTPPILTLASLTTYSSSTITKIQGLEFVGSTVMYKVTMAVPIIPEGGEIRILVDSNYFTTNNNANCRVNANFVKSTTTSSVLRCYRVSQGFRIAGFSQISAGTSISAYFFIKSTGSVTNSAISVDIYGIYQDNTTRIALANVGTVSHLNGSSPSLISRVEKMILPYYSSISSNNYYMLQGKFNLRSYNIYNGDSIYITDPGWNVYGTRRFLIKQNSSAVTGWTELNNISSSGNTYRFTMPTNFLTTLTATTGVDFIWRYTCYYSGSYYNGFVPSAGGNNKFWINTYSSNILGAYAELQYFDFTSTPSPFVLTVGNRYPAAGQQTVLDLSFTVNVDLMPGDELSFTFDSNNLLISMFANDLEGAGVSLGQTFRYLDCREWFNNNWIQNNTLVCLLYFGNNQANPPLPSRLSIFVENNFGYASLQPIRLFVSNVNNPITVGMNVGVNMSIYRSCQNQINYKCAIYAARGYYVTTSNVQNLQTTSSTFATSGNLILATGLTHTFTFLSTASIPTSGAIIILYPDNFQGLMPSQCTASGYYCYVFPSRRWVVLYPTSSITASTVTISLTAMNNGYFAQSYWGYFKVTVARPGVLGDVYNILQSPFTTVSKSPVFGNSTFMTISPTQTPNYYLRNYANTVVFTIGNIFVDARIQAIYIKAPADVTSWDGTYCNASITNTIIATYPLRFTCIVDPVTPNFLRMTLDSSDFSYSSLWADMSILVQAKFTIADFSVAPTLYVTLPVTSGAFFAYGSVNATSSASNYYHSAISQTIQISQNQVPIISTITFNQQSFKDREGKVNNKEVFYLLLKPIISNVTIGSMVFTVPSQFNYPGVFQFDNCLMIGRTIVQQPNCQQSRSNGQTLITLVPTNYDNSVKIIQLGSVSTSNWFTAPKLPGNFYNMTVALYTPSGNLIAKEVTNIAPVYGENFNIPQIILKNIQDPSIANSVYDLQFTTGSLQIPPGALTTATTQTSELQFIFQNYNAANATNVFKNDLGTGLRSGDSIGCKISSGVTAITGMLLKCLLYVGTNVTNKPMIRLINYNFINPYTTIIISFAGIQSLPAVLVNTISMAVQINYNDIGSSTYLYIPTPTITNPTNATLHMYDLGPNWPTYWQSSASFSGVNIVLQPTTFTLNIYPSYPYIYYPNYPVDYNYAYWRYDYVYSSTSSADQYILLKFYPATIIDPNNPVTVSCPTCTGVDVFYAAGMVRFRHTSSTGPNAWRTWTFTGFPTAAFSVTGQAVYVQMQIYDAYRVLYKQNITVAARTVQKCTLFNFGVVSVSSLNGGENGVTYLFSIKTNHYVPKTGALTITLPIDYGNMITNNATCSLIGFTGTNAYCSINTPSRIDIYLNGSEISTNITYSVSIVGLQNPNTPSSAFTFFVTSYYNSNIYLSQKICQNKIVPPAINIKALRQCTLSWGPQYYNQYFNSTYVFQLSCTDIFRSSSSLSIKLPTAFSTVNNAGSYSCSSYESTTLISPICTLSTIGGVFTLSTNIDATTQSSLSIIINLVNPSNNTYSANASVTSKGTAYVSGTGSSITILSNSYITSPKNNTVFLLNSPKEAGLMSTYVFKIAPISTFTPTNLGISFPSNFYFDSSQLTIAVATTSDSNFFTYLNYDNIQIIINNVSAVNAVRPAFNPTFSVTATSIYMTSIPNLLDPTKWTYVFIKGIQNPSTYLPLNFTIAYYLISNNYQSLQWVFQYPLTYFISAPPNYISVDNITVSDYDLLYPSTYTFSFSSSTNQSIAIAGTTLSYIIVIPTFYKSVLWANTAPTCKFTQLANKSSCYSYQSEIIVTETFTSNYSALNLTISFLLNPALATSCSTTDVNILSQTFFILRIINTNTNSFLFETSSVVDSKNCLTFTSVRIPISLDYSLVMVAGLAYNITYGLTRPASNLKVSAYINSSSFTFSPSIVEFNDYYALSKSTQLFLRSDVPAGTYIIYFNKSESSVTTYFRNILPVTITVIQSNQSSVSIASPTITIPTMSDSTIGYPVIIPVLFSLPSSTQMTLLLTISQETSQTLTQYSPYLANFSLTPRIISILPEQSSYNFTLIQGMRVVPPPLTLNFKLTSLYPIIHKLTTPIMYACFEMDPKFNVLNPPLKVSITQYLSSCNLKDVGKSITNIMISNSTSDSSTISVKPTVISVKLINALSTSASLSVGSLNIGTIYYLCMPAGYAAITDKNIIKNMSNTIGITGSSLSSSQSISQGQVSQINYLASINISSLTQSSNYILYVVSNSNLGTSDIMSFNFTTAKISAGVLMYIKFTAAIVNLNLVNSLVQVLRVSPLRIKIVTYSLTSSGGTQTNNQGVTYQVVVIPDATNDIISPLSIVNSFVKNTSLLAQFQTYMTTWDSLTPITFVQLRPTKPRIVALPTALQINYYNATFSIKFWEEANIYAVVYEQLGAATSLVNISQSTINVVQVSKTNSSIQQIAPSSNQIRAGTDSHNVAVSAYKALKLTTDSNGVSTLIFKDLKPGSTYQVFLTASSILPYEPTMLWSDGEVLFFSFSTLVNTNLGTQDQKKYLSEIKTAFPTLAKEIENFIANAAIQKNSDSTNAK